MIPARPTGDTCLGHVMLEIWQFWDLRPRNFRIKRARYHDFSQVACESKPRDISQRIDALDRRQGGPNSVK